MKVVKALVALALLVGLAAPTMAAAEPTPRQQVVNKHDANNDWRLKKKELKKFASANPNLYNQLMGFCEKAPNQPKKFGVKYPGSKKPKKFKCKKSKVDKPYLKAWINRGVPAKQVHPQHR